MRLAQLTEWGPEGPVPVWVNAACVRLVRPLDPASCGAEGGGSRLVLDSGEMEHTEIWVTEEVSTVVARLQGIRTRPERGPSDGEILAALENLQSLEKDLEVLLPYPARQALSTLRDLGVAVLREEC